MFEKLGAVVDAPNGSMSAPKTLDVAAEGKTDTTQNSVESSQLPKEVLIVYCAVHNAKKTKNVTLIDSEF